MQEHGVGPHPPPSGRRFSARRRREGEARLAWNQLLTQEAREGKHPAGGTARVGNGAKRKRSGSLGGERQSGNEAVSEISAQGPEDSEVEQ